MFGTLNSKPRPAHAAPVAEAYLHMTQRGAVAQHLKRISDRISLAIVANMERDVDAAVLGHRSARQRIEASPNKDKARELLTLDEALSRRLMAIRTAGRAALEEEQAAFMAAMDRLSGAHSLLSAWPCVPEQGPMAPIPNRSVAGRLHPAASQKGTSR